MYTCKFCGKGCKNKNSLAQHERRCKENPNRIESPFVKFNKDRDHVWNKGLTKNTDERVNKGANTLKNGYSTGRLVNHNKGKLESEEQKQKISISRKRYLEENPNKVPYLLNHSSKISFPEQYFIDVFENEKIPFKYHKQIGIYQLDFYNDELKLYIEIDGEQHFQEKAIKRDLARDKYLESLGWKGMRIRWSTFKRLNDNEKIEMINKIKLFYNSKKDTDNTR
jgi:very-short-patch-repair endonuclease